jgi:hypothetical protein
MTTPGYWMAETSGELAPAVHRYLEGSELSVRDVVLLRAYLRQWIDSPVWDGKPSLTDEQGREELATLRSRARLLTDRASMDDWLALADEFGVDPL